MSMPAINETIGARLNVMFMLVSLVLDDEEEGLFSQKTFLQENEVFPRQCSRFIEWAPPRRQFRSAGCHNLSRSVGSDSDVLSSQFCNRYGLASFHRVVSGAGATRAARHTLASQGCCSNARPAGR